MLKNSDSLYELALSNCSKEPIHIPGALQSFGALIGCDRALNTITHVSENILLFLRAQGDNHPADNHPADHHLANGQFRDLLGQDVSAVLPAELLHDLCNACGLPSTLSARERVGTYEVNGQPLEVSVYCHSTSVVIEFERLPAVRSRASAFALKVQSMLEHHADAKEMLSMAVQDLRARTGFDRVMAYQFGHDGSGEVVAEARDGIMEPFLGLRYPASDIPDQAKALALKTTLRVIDNVSMPEVPIVALDKFAPALDLSLAITRRPSPIHIEYLTNMGVMATMTLAIVVEGKLWGLFALHHRQPRLLRPDFRSMVELFSQLFSLRFQQVLAEEQFRDRKRTASSLNRIVTSQLPDTDWKLTIADALPQLAKLLTACGVAMVHEGNVLSSCGSVPPADSICTLTAHSEAPLKIDIVTLESLEELDLASVDAWNELAGALLIALNAEQPLYLVFFRREVATEVKWGGNPEKKDVHYGSFGPRLVPRASFTAYKETVIGRCIPWDRHDVAIALEIRSELCRLSENQMQLFQQRQQSLLISELNHRVRNILALIRSIARQTGESATSITAYTQALEQRISALATAHDFVSGHELEWPAVQRLLTIELQPYLADTVPRVTLAGPDVGFKASFVPSFVLVLHELASNAAKYGALSTSEGRLSVHWYELDGGLSLHWKETNGPPVAAPQRRGFGLDLIERSIAYEFEGESTLVFEPDGVYAKFWLPSTLVRWQLASVAEPSQSGIEVGAVAPPDHKQGVVLVVEDNMLLAIEMERALGRLGFSQIESAPSVSRAMALLDQRIRDQCPYRVGVLDIDLKKETSFEVAIALQTHNIPFVFVTGYDSKHLDVPINLSQVPRLQKPIDTAVLENTFQNLINL